uniref:Uncharacterized protein n=1 Tax=Romanomermis culicivorax TaxID=13658 RepID=A0A915JH20_ROMCU
MSLAGHGINGFKRNMEMVCGQPVAGSAACARLILSWVVIAIASTGGVFIVGIQQHWIGECGLIDGFLGHCAGDSVDVCINFHGMCGLH